MSVIKSTFSMAGKTVLVSGASSGLGAHFARVLAQAGCDNLVLSARRMHKLKEIAELIRKETPKCTVATVSIDVADLASITRGVDAAEAAVGGVMEVLINCAGIAKPSLSVEMSENDWDNVMAINLKGNFFMANEIAKRLMNVKKPGNIVNIASILSLRPGNRQANYASSKAAMLMYNKIQANEWSKHSIRCNALCPGYFASEMNDEFFSTDAGKRYLARIPPKRLGELKELNGPLLLLASEASSFMTGTEIVVDLGHTNSAL